jgi:uncharacterized protein
MGAITRGSDMGNPSAAHEPSMEEILASIRQIISEDGEQEGEGESPQGSDDAAAMTEASAGQPDMSPADDPQPDSDQADAAQSADEEPASLSAAPPAAAQPQHRPEPMLRRQPAPTPAVMTSESAAQPPQPAVASGPSPHAAGHAMAARAFPASGPGEDQRRLLSPKADASVSGAFSALAHTILAQNARTLEDLVSEMLRPMLKEWLDDNLPPLVERLVKQEIERVSRGRH